MIISFVEFRGYLGKELSYFRIVRCFYFELGNVVVGVILMGCIFVLVRVRLGWRLFEW